MSAKTHQSAPSIRRACIALCTVTAAWLSIGTAVAQAPAAVEVSARLGGHALLPANTGVAAPAAAGPLFATAGKFTAADRQRSETLGSLPGITFVGDPKFPRASGGSLQVRGQSVQGFSGRPCRRSATTRSGCRSRDWAWC